MIKISSPSGSQLSFIQHVGNKTLKNNKNVHEHNGIIFRTEEKRISEIYRKM